jgi:hypothetical protein
VAAPFELVSTPLSLYLAPVGTTFPTVDTLPASFGTQWTPVGSNIYGPTYDTDAAGITVTHNQTFATFTPVGTTAPIKMWRTDEQLQISISLADISPAQYANALNSPALTTVAATTGLAGTTSFPLLQGIPVTNYALLARGVSSINDAFNAQYQVPCVYQAANPAPVYKKGAPAELAITFATMLDPNGGGFGTLVIQSAAKV